MLISESRIGSLKHPGKKIYDFLGDFRNFEKLLPENSVNEWEADANSCRFQIKGLGKAGMKVVQKEPEKLIKITGDGPHNIDFFLWIQLKEKAENDTRIKLTLKAGLNRMMQVMAQKPVDQFLELMVDYLEKMDFE